MRCELADLRPLPNGSEIVLGLEHISRALDESRKREPDIVHHFEVSHMTSIQRNMIGFLGEFGHMLALGLPWDAAIRSDYQSIDTGDLHIGSEALDFKTETVPMKIFSQLCAGSLTKYDAYGSRLIHMSQYMSFYHPSVTKYDLVIFGAMPRQPRIDPDGVSVEVLAGQLEPYLRFCALGWCYTEEIQEAEYGNYLPNGRRIPFRAKMLHPPMKSMEELTSGLAAR